jgi:hypothetical protein
MLTLSAVTTRPQLNMFGQGTSGRDFITVTVGGISSYEGTSFWLDYTITGIFDQTVEANSLEFTKSGGNSQTRQIAIDKSRLDHFTFTATIPGGAPGLGAVGTRPKGFITYAVVPDPRRRPAKASYNQPNVDKSIYFGMAFFSPNIDPNWLDGLYLGDYLGIDATIGGGLTWRGNITGSGDNQRTNTAAIEGNSGGAITWPVYQLIEMTPYFPNEFRTVPNGAYGGELNALGEQELIRYVQSLAKLHIDKAGNRPHHYYQVLWEPVDWWYAWLPAGDAGDRSIVRFYEVAYKAIHEVYDQKAASSGNQGWKTKPVVLGPTNSDATNFNWHKRLFDKGLANFIDGLSIHPYDPEENGLAGGGGTSSGRGNDLVIANAIRDLMALVNERYASRSTTKYHAKPFFWGTEQGMQEATRGGRPLQVGQVLTRYNLIMMGEGFDANHMFCFADTDTETRYGFFYNLTDRSYDVIVYYPHTVSPKPAASALAATSWLLKGYRGAGRIPGLSGTNLGYKYTDTESSAVIYAVWNHAGTTSSATISSKGSYKVYDIVGNEISSGSGDISLATSGYVQYVKVGP